MVNSSDFCTVGHNLPLLDQHHAVDFRNDLVNVVGGDANAAFAGKPAPTGLIFSGLLNAVDALGGGHGCPGRGGFAQAGRAPQPDQHRAERQVQGVWDIDKACELLSLHYQTTTDSVLKHAALIQG